MSGIGRGEFLAATQGAALAVAGPAYLYPNAAHAADAAKAAKKPAATGGAERAGESGMNDYHFKLGMYLPELGLPFDEALATAKRCTSTSRISSNSFARSRRAPSPVFSPRGEAKCVRGPSVQGARRSPPSSEAPRSLYGRRGLLLELLTSESNNANPKHENRANDQRQPADTFKARKEGGNP